MHDNSIDAASPISLGSWVLDDLQKSRTRKSLTIDRTPQYLAACNDWVRGLFISPSMHLPASQTVGPNSVLSDCARSSCLPRYSLLLTITCVGVQMGPSPQCRCSVYCFCGNKLILLLGSPRIVSKINIGGRPAVTEDT